MFLNIFTIVIQLSFSILCFYGAVHLVRKESLFTRPIIVKNLEAFLLVVVVGSLFGLMSFVTAHNDLYKPWAIKKTISKAISERNISFIIKKLNDRDFLEVLSTFDKTSLQSINNEQFIESLLFEAERKAKYGYNKYALIIISKIGGPAEAAKLVDLLVRSKYQRIDIIKSLKVIGDSRAKSAMYAAIVENSNKAKSINGKLLQEAIEDTLEELGDIRPSINKACSVAIKENAEKMNSNNKKMFKKGPPWRYMIEDNVLIPPSDTAISILSPINSIACVKAHYKKMFFYATGSLPTTSLSGDAVKITWDIYILDSDMKSITATKRLVGEDPPRTITVNKFNAPFGKHGYGIQPIDDYERWIKELDTKQ